MCAFPWTADGRVTSLSAHYNYSKQSEVIVLSVSVAYFALKFVKMSWNSELVIIKNIYNYCAFPFLIF
jgi:hypothetical protein